MYNQKEIALLNDMKTEEALCIEKYRDYAERASNEQLKSLMNKLGNEEQEHFNTISKLIAGDVPTLNPKEPKSPVAQAVENITASDENYKNDKDAFDSDKFLCADALGTEKHISAVYNTDIFEFKDEKVRDVLNHIQKEEQEHGKKLFNYMEANGMYMS